MRKVSDPPDDPFSATMRERSGEYDSPSLMVGFLYLLMRDHITPGTVEYMMIQLAKEGWVIEPRKDMEFTNGWLARYAEDVSLRLLEVIPLEKKPVKYEVVELPEKPTYLAVPYVEE